MTTTDKFPVAGCVADGFEPVRRAFEENFTKHGEVGGAVYVTLKGVPVVDLWGGAADAAVSRPWEADTLVNVWSTTKGWLALAMHMLADCGLLDVDAPVARYWPEFSRHGKEAVLVRHVLTHTAGLPGPSVKVPNEALYDWDMMVHALEESELLWKPGTQCGYHAATFGWLNGEVLRRITGVSPGSFIRAQIAGPLNADAFVGLSEDEQARAAETIPPEVVTSPFARVAMLRLNRARRRAYGNPPRPPTAANTRRWRESEILSSNGHASARGLARVYTALALGGEMNGVRLLSKMSLENASREQVHAKDIVTGSWERRSLGFLLPPSGDPRPPDAFGHSGMGGSMGFADPQNQLAMGYVMNKLITGPDARWVELCRALYASLNIATAE